MLCHFDFVPEHVDHDINERLMKAVADGAIVCNFEVIDLWEALGLLPCTNDMQQEWITYPCYTSHSILRWLPSTPAGLIAENQVQSSNRVGETTGAWADEESEGTKDPPAKNLVETGGGHHRAFTTPGPRGSKSSLLSL